MLLESGILPTNIAPETPRAVEPTPLETYLSAITGKTVDEISDNKVEYSNNGMELLKGFEDSDEYKISLEQRMSKLQSERPYINLSDPELKQDIIDSFRGLPEYNISLHHYYNSHRLVFDDLPPQAQDAIHEYWNYILFVIRQLGRLSGDEQAFKDAAARYDRERDRYHIYAANTLLGDICGSDNANHAYDSDHVLAGWLNAGRQLVSLLTEEEGLDKADPYREIKKRESRKNNALLDSMGLK